MQVKVAIDPRHCGVYKKGCDGPYVVRRAVYCDANRYYVIVSGERISVKRNAASEENAQAVHWESYDSRKEAQQ